MANASSPPGPNGNNKDNGEGIPSGGNSEEEKFVQSFHNVFVANPNRLAGKPFGPAIDPSAYEAELKQLHKCYAAIDFQGFLGGTSVGLATYFFLRLGAQRAARVIRRNVRPPSPSNSNASYRFNEIPSTSQSVLRRLSATKGRGEWALGWLDGWLLRWAAFAISALASAKTQPLLSGPAKRAEYWSSLPLVAGRSFIADRDCHAMQNIYQQTSPTVWERHRGKGDLFDHAEKFVLNCMRRAAVEKQLREEQGLPPDAVVSIPPPGISAAMEVEKPPFTGAPGDGDENQTFTSLDTFDADPKTQ